MTRTRHHTDDSTDPRLTEEEYEEATAEEQIRNDFELKLWDEIKSRDDVEKILELRAGELPERGEPDKRRIVQIYETPAGYFEYVGDEVYTHTELHEVKPDVFDVVEAVEYFVSHSINQHNRTLEDSYQFTDFTDRELAVEVEDELRKQFQS